MSFAHGSQDGLKFIGILYIYTKIVTNNVCVINENLIMIICALTMGFGVLIGGKRIVSTVGEKIVKLNNEEALCTDLSTITTLIIANMFGMPISTTHVKTVSIISLPSTNNINIKKFLEIVKAWALTFPICGLISYILMSLVN